MKLKLNLIAGAVLASVASISAFAQVAPPPVPNGSMASRAALPMHRPFDFVRITQVTSNGSVPAHSRLVATSIGGPVANQVVTMVAPPAPFLIATATPGPR